VLVDNVFKNIVITLFIICRLQESSDALEENERLKQTIKHKEERVRILQVSLDQNQQEINSLESR
jgi:cell division septum initiation protein DivIVA